MMATASCGGEGVDEPPWVIVAQDLPGGLLSVWGTSASDVWAVGGDARDGTGPTVLRIQDGEVERIETGEVAGDLMWVHGFADGPIFLGGSGGVILRYENGAFTRLATPGTETVFGLWGASPDDMWAVGGASDTGGGFAWRLVGDEFVPEATLPADVPETGAIWKMHGIAADDAWLVGSNGLAFYWDGETLTRATTGVGSSLFTVFGTADHFAAVGGLGSGIIVENDPDRDGRSWVDVTPDPLPESLSGVALDGDGGGYAVGVFGNVYRRSDGGWEREQLGFALNENLHGVWLDPDGGVWAAGGNTFALPLTAGVLIHKEGN